MLFQPAFMDLLQCLTEDEEGRQLEARWDVEVEDFSVSVAYILIRTGIDDFEDTLVDGFAVVAIEYVEPRVLLVTEITPVRGDFAELEEFNIVDE